ncbi:hypothetical protein ATE80_14500 [Streptomyces kanasensis]|uniref:Uncharacterized protein n=1 Tax=Streptomyces kanasensis TaxID=936756 RepID=A0A100Y5I3_9ACTN|nr:hypothetical protein ATE80_14500 [Streptomyces kanasensis]
MTRAWYSRTTTASASMRTRRSNQSGCSTFGYQSTLPHSRSSIPPVPSSSSQRLAKVSWGTRVPDSTRAMWERSQGMSRARASWVRPAASRWCFSTSPKRAAVVDAAPPVAFLLLTVAPSVTVDHWHAVSVELRHRAARR